ncbi:3'-5' exonuclease [Caulobacter sp. Root656]|nr:3'-5' exonuclease [Caulobacter sp. Root656]
MTGEMEAAAADSVTAFFKRRRKHAFEGVGKPCANCGTLLEGPYCHACGQDADNHKRSIGHLIWEAIEGMFHLDGRLALTLPALFFRPGTLAKDYMEGRIVRHVPPFRTFLVALLLFIFAAEHAIHSAQHHAEEEAHRRAEALATPQGRAAEAARMRAEAATERDARLKEAATDRDAALAEAASDRDEALKDPDENRAKVQERYQVAAAKAPIDYQDEVVKAQARYAEALAKADRLQNNPLAAQEILQADETMRRKAAERIRGASLDPTRIGEEAAALAEGAGDTTTIGGVTVKTPEAHDAKSGDAAHGGKEHWFKAGLAKAFENPEYYMVVMFGWGHRLAVLLLPMLGLSLTLVYLNKRQFFIYDHLIVATNLLSFAFLTNALGLVLPDPVRKWWFLLLMVWTPINLFQTLRGAYGSSVPGAIAKTLIVWWSTMVSFVLLLTGLLIFALAQI